MTALQVSLASPCFPLTKSLHATRRPPDPTRWRRSGRPSRLGSTRGSEFGRIASLRTARLPSVPPMVLALLVAVVPVSLAPALSPLVANVTSSPGNGPVGSVSATLANGPLLGTHLADQFYEVVFTDAGTPTPDLVRFGAYLNSTPITLVRFGGAGQGYDPTTETNYLPPANGAGAYVAHHVELWNLPWFKSWCLSKTPHCAWLSYLPGEENNTGAALHVAKWFHSILNFVPTYWEFGNEPTQWTHYGKNLTKWSTADASAPTSTGYATMVHDYIQTVSALYPNDRFVGLEAACACNKQLAAETAKVNGAAVAALAYHSYPTSSTSSRQLTGFYGLLASLANISSTAAQFRSGVSGGCARCSTIPVELGEYQAGPFSAFSPFVGEYAAAPFLASSLIEAMQANLTTVSVYNIDNLYNAGAKNASFEGLLYQRILANLTMGSDYRVSVRGSGVSGVYSVLIKNGTREAVLVVDTSLATGLSLKVPSGVFPVGAQGSTWSWSPGTKVPSYASYSSLPGSYSVPSQGILLIANY